MQEVDGFVGHMIFWKSSLPRNLLNVLQARPRLSLLRPHMSALIQPPMAAQAVLLANWFLYHCLRFRNFHAEAETLLLTVQRLIEQSGFREYYNPFSGAGYGARQFTWSGLVVDLLRMKTSAGGEESMFLLEPTLQRLSSG